MTKQPRDTLRRPLRDLRVSVTDRCNFRCDYCMPADIFNSDHKFLQRAELLSFEEILRIISLLTKLGIKKIRLTGGEPLIRQNIDVLIGEISRLNAIEDISMTSNASLLDIGMAQRLKRAGLSRLTVSLDALDNDVFRALNGVDIAVTRVLAGIDNALAAGFSPLKINTVVKRCNYGEVMPLVRHFRHSDCILRFIEYMDVGQTNGWKMDEVVPGTELIEMISAEFPLQPIATNYPGEVAKRWRYLDGAGEIGFITSVTQPFCRDCTRLRMSAKGELYTCLFAAIGHDLRGLLRSGVSDDEIVRWLRGLWHRRADRYSEKRAGQTQPLNKVEMSYIGG